MGSVGLQPSRQRPKRGREGFFVILVAAAAPSCQDELNAEIRVHRGCSATMRRPCDAPALSVTP